ncbi:excisionase family DNA-binding protein [Leucobacter sp. OH1287]|uniref:excisionase family DNA-binding protein n=1 Tax=Leucobacter sp. OH1287 TaxID=2491049 RepID=UPI000F5DC5D2|nr:excisionase family DNA-binding protein [Leucobacter sp. OH1287]RRD61657.1 hypothetical protein EII30_02180 [Leucobacter sp. OH1287]
MIQLADISTVRPVKAIDIIMPPADAVLWTKREVAGYLRISIRSVEKLVADGRLRKLTVLPGGVRFHRDDVKGLIYDR